MLKAEVYYRCPADGSRGHWYYSINEVDQRGVVLDRLRICRCKGQREAKLESVTSLAFFAAERIKGQTERHMKELEKEVEHGT